MTFLSYLLIRDVPYANTQPALAETGLLQWTYLLGKAPTFPDLVADVEEPSVEELRWAGMEEVWEGAGVQGKGKEYGDEEEQGKYQDDAESSRVAAIELREK
jgi:hypothetical protein